MTPRGDYRDRMGLKEFTDEDIDRLISGEDRHPELASLASFVAALRGRALFEPRPGDVERTSIRAAAVVRSQLLSTRSATLPALGSRSAWRRLSERTTIVLGSILAVAAMSGVGLAADAAVPGDFLYGIDLALEELGVGDGSIDERLDEAGALLEKDDLAGAVELLAAWISLAEPDVSVSAFAAAIEALDDLSSDLNDQSASASAVAQEKVNDLLEFIEANAGSGNGLDGKEFGQGVALIAQGGVLDDGQPESDTPAGPDAPGNSENSSAGGNGIGGSEETPGDSGNSNGGTDTSGGGSGETPGNSGNSNAGGNGNGAGGPENSNAGGNGKSNGGGKP